MIKVLDWTLRVAAAAVLLQTLFFKFSGSSESVFIFSTLGVEPWGRFAAGAAELVAAVLLLVPRTAWLGAGAGIAVMAGAIISHLGKLGIEVQGDGGLLFGLAVGVLLCCAASLYIHRRQVPMLGGVPGSE